MLGRKPFFQGSNPLHQLETIIAKMGVPPKEQLSFVTHPAARKAVMARVDQRPRPLASYFPAGTNTKALDLLQKVGREEGRRRRRRRWKDPAVLIFIATS